jgi:hypothetical protein
MKAVVMSDLHGYLPDVKTIKEAEVMFICGDIVPLEIQDNIKKSRLWIYTDFLNWTNSLPVDKVFIIGGNHDFFLEHILEENVMEDSPHKEIVHEILFDNEHKLQYIFDTINYKSKDGNEYTIKTIPYIENCNGWAFSEKDYVIKAACEVTFNEHFDILLTHDAPDIKPFSNKWGGDVLANSIKNAMIHNTYPNYWFFGHIHDNPHILPEQNYKTEMYNTSLRNNMYGIVYEPLYIDIVKKPIAPDNGLVITEYTDYNKDDYVCGDYITSNRTGETVIYHHTNKDNECVYYIAADSARVVTAALPGISTYGNMDEYRHSTKEEIIKMNKDVFFKNDLIWNENFLNLEEVPVEEWRKSVLMTHE